MNAEAEKEIDRLQREYWTEHGLQLSETIRRAMQWAYQDAAKVCKGVGDRIDDNEAGNCFAAAIEERAKCTATVTQTV